MDAWAPTAVLLIVLVLAAAYWLNGRAQARRARLGGRSETLDVQTLAPVTPGAWLTPPAANDREPGHEDLFEAPFEDAFEKASAGKVGTAFPPVAPLQPLPSLRSLPALPPLAACAPEAGSPVPRTP